MLGKYKRQFIGACWLVLVLQLIMSVAFAQGEGGMQGRNQKPLDFTSITLVEGGDVQDAADVPTEPAFKVQFDKNVVNSLVWENNSKCFSLLSADGAELPLRVTKVDDSIDFTQKQIIFVKPDQPLQPGTVYYLKISPALKAKNGITLGATRGEGISITFKTAGEASVQRTDTPSPGQSDTVTGAADEPASVQDKPLQDNSHGAVINEASTVPPGKPQDPAENFWEKLSGSGSRIITLCMVVLGGWIVFEIWVRKSKQRRV